MKSMVCIVILLLESVLLGTASAASDSQISYTGHTAHGLPVYSELNLSPPSLVENDSLSWGTDSAAPQHQELSSWPLTNIRSEHPRLFAPRYKWQRLPWLIGQDEYLRRWNDTIFEKAEDYINMPPVTYSIDGGLAGSGVLDVARQVQLRVKHWAYAYRMSNDTRWAERTWEELVVASGNSSQYFGESGDNWNTQHWLDVGEFITAFAFAYDWLYEAWNSTQRDSIMWSIISLGLKKGMNAYDSDAWFLSTNGNWNCVTNGGMIVGSLAIYEEDPTGTAAKLLGLAVPNAQQNCAQAVYSDGTWTETANYWYFGVQGHAQMASALFTATGSSQQLLTINPAFVNTSLYHIYVYGMTDLFNYGDCGPNKYTATANAMLFYGDQFNIPMFTLYQRDYLEAADPLSMFWYNPQVVGGWYIDLPLDHNFPNPDTPWVSLRSSWTDPTGLFAAMKAGGAVGHQTHGDIDAGDFVIDALGERWAGELCQDNYLATGYFSSEAQDSVRWLYYRKGTEGQNTILYNGSNQIVDASSFTRFESSGNVQTSSGSSNTHNTNGDENNTAYWIANLTMSYNGTAVERGMRLLNDRTQVLIQDEITNATAGSQWRMHTNASITYDRDNKTANLALHGKYLTAILQSPANASFRTLQPTRLPTSPPLPAGETDMPNEGVSVLAVDIPPGSHKIAVVFSPRWNKDWKPVIPPLVALEDWRLDSHS